MSSKDPKLAEFFNTRFFLPGWWARAYEQSVCTKNVDSDPFELSSKMGIAPALSVSEINALAVVATSIQGQILNSFSDEITFNPSEFQKHATTRNQTKLFNYTKLLQSLPGIRFFSLEKAGCVEPTPAFENERWLAQEKILKFGLKDFGAEIFLGYSDPHLHTVRSAKGEFSPRAILGREAPLAIWRSPWMELGGVDQILFMRLEKAMQWQCKWLHFDGIFGLGLNEFIDSVDFSALRRSPGGGEVDNLRVALLTIEKLGKRLCQHGLLKFQVNDEYMALDALDRDGPLLVWQASAEKISALDADAYRKRCIRYLCCNKLGPRLYDFIKLFSYNVFGEDLYKRVRKCWDILIAVEDELAFMPLADSASSTPVAAAPLFLEWAMRSMTAHRFPLPEELSSSQVGRLAGLLEWDSLAADMVSERFRAFVNLVHENPDFRMCIEKETLGSFASRKAQSSEEFAKLVESFNQGALQLVSSDADVVSEASVIEETHEAIAESADVDAPKKKTMSEQNMRRIANQELALIKSSEPDRYKQLKKAYFDSLDGPRRKFMLDLQNMMQPEVFENQLKQSLIKFMIENPGVWKSAKGFAPKTNRLGIVALDFLQ